MRDVSKILTDADLLKLRELLKQVPNATPPGPDAFEEYPKMLFHPDWLMCYRLIKDHPDPIVKKDASEKLRNVQLIVQDFETEEEYLADGWKTDPIDLILALGETNPRIPTGREGRRASARNAQDRESELRTLKRRYAELTGRRIGDEATQEDAMVASQPPPTNAPPTMKAKTPPPASKRERVAAATKRSTSSIAHA